MKRDLSKSNQAQTQKCHSMLFLELEKLFRSKGHSENRSTELAYEALEVLNDWYEDEAEGA